MLKKIISFMFLIILNVPILNASSTYDDMLKSANFLASKSIIKYNKDTPSLYRLNKTITRKETMKIVMKLSGLTIEDKCEGKFKDVTNDWGCKYIESALKAGFIASNDNFRPNDNITKTESMKLVLKAKGISKIKETSNWKQDYMETAYDYGIISKKYYDFNADAKRGWIFIITTATIKKQEKIKEIIKERSVYSDEASVN